MKWTVKQREFWKADALKEIRKRPVKLNGLCDGRRAPEKIELAVNALIATGKVTRDSLGYLRANS